MDAFAVSLCKGLCMERIKWGQAAFLGVLFGGFQALMPLIGWALGSRFIRVIAPYDHWIAFSLLALIGMKMIADAVHEGEEECAVDGGLDLVECLLLAIATSIDALAVGLTFAALNVPIVGAVTLIGIVTCALSMVGVAIGATFGSHWRKPASIAGGTILILIGAKILLEHLGIFVL